MSSVRLLPEVPLQQALERLAVTGFIEKDFVRQSDSAAGGSGIISRHWNHAFHERNPGSTLDFADIVRQIARDVKAFFGKHRGDIFLASPVQLLYFSEASFQHVQ